jgi:benzodiazapine receptor
MERTKRHFLDGLGLLVAVLACYGAAAIGGLLTAGAVRDWYPTLTRPTWTPPSWLFGPVWTFLYGAMAVSVWLIWRRRGRESVALPVAAFGVQLVFNSVWTPLFFGLHRVDLALVDIVLLWLALVVVMCLFFRRSVAAGVLLVPYFLWVSFAMALNFRLWQLNG